MAEGHPGVTPSDSHVCLAQQEPSVSSCDSACPFLPLPLGIRRPVQELSSPTPCRYPPAFLPAGMPFQPLVH